MGSRYTWQAEKEKIEPGTDEPDIGTVELRGQALEENKGQIVAGLPFPFSGTEPEAKVLEGQGAFMRSLVEIEPILDDIYERYDFPERLRGEFASNELGILEMVIYKEAFGSGNFPVENEQHVRNLTKRAHSVASKLNQVFSGLFDIYSDGFDKEAGPSLSQYNIKPRTLPWAAIVAIKDDDLRQDLVDAYDSDKGYVPEWKFDSIIGNDKEKALEVVAGMLTAFSPMIEQVRELKQERNQKFTVEDEIKEYYSIFHRGPEQFAVIYLQKDLVAAGFLTPEDVDGGMGDTTQGALDAYEESRGFPLTPPVSIPINLKE